MTVGTKSGLPGLSEDLQGPEEVLLGPKRALFGASQLDPVGPNLVPKGCPRTSRAPKGPFKVKMVPNIGYFLHIRPKCVLTMSPTQLDQLTAVWTKSGPLGLSEDLRGPQMGLLLLGPIWALFGEDHKGLYRGQSSCY